MKMRIGFILLSFLLGNLPAFAQDGSELIRQAEKIAQDRNEDRIVGGAPVPLQERPWQVGLVLANVKDDFYAQFCGGSIVSPGWIVTAAHCVDSGTQPEQLQVLFSAATLNESGNRISVVDILIHPDWTPATFENDVALLRIDGRISTQASIKLANKEIENDATTLIVSGWGRIDQFGVKSENLLAVSVPIQTNETCNEPESYDGAITEDMLCAGELSGGADACQGDSGGPATISVDGDIFLAGIVSWGDSCAEPKKFGVYSRISVLRTWILENVPEAQN